MVVTLELGYCDTSYGTVTLGENGFKYSGNTDVLRKIMEETQKEYASMSSEAILYFLPRLRRNQSWAKIIEEKSDLKFNPYHDHLGRFTSGGGLGLVPPGQGVLPGMDDISLLNPNAFRQAQLLPKLTGQGTYTNLVAMPDSVIDDKAYQFPITDIQANMKAGNYSPLGDSSEGDNPRFTTTVNGQEFFVKRLEGRVLAGDPQDFINNELAARTAAVTLGLASVTIPVATFSMKMKPEAQMYDEYGDYTGDAPLTPRTYKFLTQPMIKSNGNGFEFEEHGGDLDAVVASIPKTQLTKMVAYEYLIGTRDRHWGQYLIQEDAPPTKKIILNDFDYGFPTHSGSDYTPHLWNSAEESPNFSFSRQSLEEMYAQKKTVLASVKGYLSASQYNALDARFTLLHNFAKAIGDGEYSISYFDNYINSNMEDF